MPSASKACVHCGGRVDVGDKFCYGCGTEVSGLRSPHGPQSAGVGLLEPRGWLGTFVVFSSVSGVLFGVVWGVWMHAKTGMPFAGGMVSGVFFGLIFGSAMAFYMKGEILKIPVTDKQDFLYRMNTLIAQIGYVQESNSDALMMYKPSFQAGLLSGRISVTVGQEEATIVGPAVYIKKLRKGLSA